MASSFHTSWMSFSRTPHLYSTSQKKRTIIAERLSARHLILLRGRLAFVYIYIYPSRCLGTRTCCLRTSFHTWCSYVYVRVCVSCVLHVFLGLSCTDHGAEEVATCGATQWSQNIPKPHVFLQESGAEAQIDVSVWERDYPGCTRPDSTARWYNLREAFYCAFCVILVTVRVVVVTEWTVRCSVNMA